MCKIKITEKGGSRKSCSESFARPHPTPLPAALPPPLPLPSAVVNIAPVPARQQTTEREREACEKIGRGKCIQNPLVHHPKTTAHVPKSNTHAPNKIALIPNIHNLKTSTQVEAPKKIRAQQKNIQIQNPIAKRSIEGKISESKSGKQKKPIGAAPDTGGNSSDNKKAKQRRVISTEQKRLPERLEDKIPDVDAPEPSPGINSPSPNAPLLRNVRFAIGESRRTLSTTSSSSTSSEDSFIDSHPSHTPTNPNAIRKQSMSKPASPNSTPSYFANMEENDSMESDASSNIDVADTVGSKMLWEDTGSFRDPGPAKSQSHNMRGDTSIRDGKAASSVPYAGQHDHMGVLGQSPTGPWHQLIPEQEWETMSDQESAIDCGGPSQPQVSDPNISSWDWMQGQNSHEDSGFNAWLKSLETSHHVENSSPTSSSPKSLKEPILVYQTKRTRFAKTEKGPLLAIKKSPRIEKSHHAHKREHLQSEVEKVEEPEITQATRNSSYKSPSVVDVAEEPINYDPGLQIFWRDV